uniref:Uncharacterized protein n=1 Tax=Anguilla anguilla TaxID=7936 RepID=A0A0E9QFH3_ANGAN
MDEERTGGAYQSKQIMDWVWLRCKFIILSCWYHKPNLFK